LRHGAVIPYGDSKPAARKPISRRGESFSKFQLKRKKRVRGEGKEALRENTHSLSRPGRHPQYPISPLSRRNLPDPRAEKNRHRGPKRALEKRIFKKKNQPFNPTRTCPPADETSEETVTEKRDSGRGRERPQRKRSKEGGGL